MGKFYFIGFFEDDDNEDHKPTPYEPQTWATLSDSIKRFLIIGLYLFIMFSDGVWKESNRHLEITATDSYVDKSATYFFHYTLCLPATYYFKATSWLNTHQFVRYDNMNSIIQVILVIAFFFLVITAIRLPIIYTYLIILFSGVVIYIVLEMIIWLFK